jgi:pullulanase/glycogen debranching enzyme
MKVTGKTTTMARTTTSVTTAGWKGTAPTPKSEALRKRQIKNFLLTLFISRGVPMLLSGDEVRRTQGGNNNAYCQDNATSWFDWASLGAACGNSFVLRAV